ncbi:MAG: ribbon-helix-helix domain-containing protein [Alphaproteobacteria bacterium]|nr:ribbon-helix-helix domain-containing protein [Alphaproteobacteria bacterium]MCW5750648.1 ribbon-helix-helix domain-containing protein [Alphaproteobacteria bacterium]
MPTVVRKRSVVVAGHRTSVSLESAFWEALREIALAEGKTLNQMVSDIDRERTGNLSSAIRVFVLRYVQGAQAAKQEPGRPAAADGGEGAAP